MLNITVLHDSYQTIYREPFGAARCGDQVRLRLKITGPAVADCQVCLRVGEKQEIRLPMARMDLQGDALWFEVVCTMPEEPGLVWYYFVFASGKEIHYYGNNASQLGGVGALYIEKPPVYQITVYREVMAPSWYKEGIMYQIYVDRFCNGLPCGQILHPKKNSLIHGNWNDPPFYVKDAQGRVLRWTFFGGNLQGIIEKLPYLEALGITILYLNPIFESPSNHKYDTGDYHTVDPMYGDEEILARLVRESGKCGISIILDGVFAHTGSDSIYFNRYGNYPGTGAYRSEASPYFSWYEKEEGGQRFKYWWGVEDLPKVRVMEDSYRAFIFGDPNSVIRHWMKLGVKGWRLDVADELPDEFLKELRKAVKNNDSESVLIGEVWEDASNKISYGIQRKYLLGDALDGVTNYPFRSVMLNFLLGKAFAEEACRKLMSLLENYPPENLRASMNLIGSHDRIRILTILGEAPPSGSLSEEEKAFWRLGKTEKEKAVKRLRLLTLLQMTLPGVPCIYYGDEAGLEGYEDPYNRGTYPWGREDSALIDWYQRMLKLRHEYPVIFEGTWRPWADGTDVLGVKIHQSEEEMLIMINRNVKENAPVRFELKGDYLLDLLEGKSLPAKQMSDKQTETDYEYTMTLEPLSAKLFYSLKQNPYQTMERACGILLHPTSLPSPWKIGDIGEPAERFVDFLAASGHRLWQLLPLNPTGQGYSPYDSGAVFAGNWLLISLEKLQKQGLLEAEELEAAMDQGRPLRQDQADYPGAEQQKLPLLIKAYRRFREQHGEESDAYRAFLADHVYWLEDYIQHPMTQEMDLWHGEPQEGPGFRRFLQFIFFSQWAELKAYANHRQVRIIGDMPFYSAAGGADVSAHPQWFKLDAEGRPLAVSGVPADSFNPEGQRWGTPVYHWANQKMDGFSWWIQRMHHMQTLYDVIRIDHFRGFEAFWEVMPGAGTAVEGRWLKGPGQQLFQTMKKVLGPLPLIAEDLGFITPEVYNLRNIMGIPGTRVHQTNPIREDEPAENLDRCVYYSGTHDHETLQEWVSKNWKGDRKDPDTLRFAVWEVLREIYESQAPWVIFPLQDILGLGAEARMNRPGLAEGNWLWRLGSDVLTGELAEQLRRTAEACRRFRKEGEAG